MRTKITLTTSWQQIGSGIGTLTITSAINNAKIYLNTDASDTGADERKAEVNKQCIQTEAVPTYAKSSVAGGITIIWES